MSFLQNSLPVVVFITGALVACASVIGKPLNPKQHSRRRNTTTPLVWTRWTTRLKYHLTAALATAVACYHAMAQEPLQMPSLGARPDRHRGRAFVAR